MPRAEILSLFTLFLFISSTHSLYRHLDPTILGDTFVPKDLAAGENKVIACGHVTGSYFLNNNNFTSLFQNVSRASVGVIIFADITTEIYTTLMAVPSKDDTTTSLTNIQVIDEETTLIFGSSTSPKLFIHDSLLGTNPYEIDFFNLLPSPSPSVSPSHSPSPPSPSVASSITSSNTYSPSPSVTSSVTPSNTHSPSPSTAPSPPPSDTGRNVNKFILTLTSSGDEDGAAVVSDVVLLDENVDDISAYEKFKFVTRSHSSGDQWSLNTVEILGDNSAPPSTLLNSPSPIDMMQMINETHTLYINSTKSSSSIALISSSTPNYPTILLTINYKEGKMEIKEMEATLEDEHLTVTLIGSYNSGAHVQVEAGCDWNLQEDGENHIFIASLTLDTRTLNITQCVAIADNSSHIEASSASLTLPPPSSSQPIVFMGSFQPILGVRGSPILQFGNGEEDACRKPVLSADVPTTFTALFDRSLRCLTIGTFAYAVTENINGSVAVVGEQVQYVGSKPVGLFLNSSVDVQGHTLSAGVFYVMLLLASQPPSPLPPSSSSVLPADYSSHPHHSLQSLSSYYELSSDDEVVIPWYSSLIVIFLLVAAVIGTVVLFNVYNKYRKAKAASSRNHRFSRVNTNEEF